VDQETWECIWLIRPITVDDGEMNEFTKRLNEHGSEGWE
jgi:hypothetical protein